MSCPMTKLVLTSLERPLGEDKGEGGVRLARLMHEASARSPQGTGIRNKVHIVVCLVTYSLATSLPSRLSIAVQSGSHCALPHVRLTQEAKLSCPSARWRAHRSEARQSAMTDECKLFQAASETIGHTCTGRHGILEDKAARALGGSEYRRMNRRENDKKSRKLERKTLYRTCNSNREDLPQVLVPSHNADR